MGLKGALINALCVEHHSSVPQAIDTSWAKTQGWQIHALTAMRQFKQNPEFSTVRTPLSPSSKAAEPLHVHAWMQSSPSLAIEKQCNT